MKKKPFLLVIMIAICEMLAIHSCQTHDSGNRSVPAAKATDGLTAKQLFRKSGTDKVEDFTTVQRTYCFDVVNESKSYLMLTFITSPEAQFSPTLVRLAPGGRQKVTMESLSETKSYSLSYALALSPKPFTTHTDRYRAYNDGETVMCIPVDPKNHAALLTRTTNILLGSQVELTDKAMPKGTLVYTPGPFYRGAFFARDFLYQLEGSGRYTVTAEEVKRAVDFLALKELTENRKVGAFTYPKGAIPDHIYPDGQYCWGPGAFYGDNTAHFRRPSMDEAMCFVILGWHYGYKAGWDTAWQSWFRENAHHFADAWNSVPRNASTGLVTQWTTPGHIGANGIKETNGACVMWGFHDSYGFGGDDMGTSVLACNAARALADMYDHSGGDTTSVKVWDGIANTMRDAIRAQFNPKGYLPWGVGKDAPVMASPDITGYAVWSGILTDSQADAASDWFADRYRADKSAGGAADLFQMSAPFRGAIRMARKADDVSPGRHVWPDMPGDYVRHDKREGEHWENLTYGYNAYQDGGYWYYKSLGVAVALWRKHPDLTREWVSDVYADLAGADSNHPYERIDGMKPVNDRYNASVGSLMGMGMPAVTFSVNVVKGNSISEYQKMQKKLANGWNTWNARSVLSHVLLPEGFAINICLKEYKAGRYLKESLIGRFQNKFDPRLDYRGGELVEKVTPYEHAYDGSYTKLNLLWRDIELNIQTATIDDELVILVSPVKNQRYPATLVIESGILWNRQGSIEKDGEVIVGNLPKRQVRVYTTKSWISDPYLAVQTPYAAMKMDEEIGVSTGKKRTIDEIKTIIEHKRQLHLKAKEKYGDLSEVYNAIQSCLAWATVYEPKKERVITTISRTWDIDRNFGGYLIGWDVFFHGFMASLDNKELAYANVIGRVKENVKEGFVPFAATGSGWSTLDKSSPPVGSIIVKDFYRRFGDKWVLEEVFDDLLSWNRWLFKKRQIADGLLAWGTNPYEPIYDNFFELHSVDELFGAKLESGMDNSTMWDDVTFNKQKHMMEYADIGLISMYIADCEALADISDILGKKPEASELRMRSQQCKNSLKTLWDEHTGIFLNKHTDTGKFDYRLSPTNFYPLLTDVPTKVQADRMIKEHFYNPDEFWGEWIIPCSTRKDPGYKDQYYWRGRIWAPTNFLVYLGMQNYGLTNAKKDLAEKSKNLLLKEWLEKGHIHENYNADLGIGCDDTTESEKFYTWSGLYGILSFIEAGYYK